MSPDPLVERLAQRLARRGLALPALVMVEAGRPLSFLANQLLVCCEPFLDVAGLAGPHYQGLLHLTEERSRLAALADRLEELL